MQNQFFHFSRLLGKKKKEVEFLEEKAKGHPNAVSNFGNELMEIVCSFLRVKEIATFISSHKVTAKHHQKIAQTAKEAHEKAELEFANKLADIGRNLEEDVSLRVADFISGLQTEWIQHHFRLKLARIGTANFCENV